MVFIGGPRQSGKTTLAKHYHLDWTVITERGARFENLIACHLLKWVYFLQDTEGREMELRYFRDVDKREVDFVVLEDKRPVHFIECKSSGKTQSPSLRYLKVRFPTVPATQVTLDDDVDLVTRDHVRICSAHLFLRDLV